MYMTLRKRFLDLLPALTVFAAIAAFGTYVAIAYVARDPWWLHTLAEHAQQREALQHAHDVGTRG